MSVERELPIFLHERYNLQLHKDDKGNKRWEVREVRTNYIVAVARDAKKAMKEFQEKMQIGGVNSHREVSAGQFYSCTNCGASELQLNGTRAECGNCGNEWDIVERQNELYEEAVQSGE